MALMAGLKAIVLWVPPSCVALANGCMVMIAALAFGLIHDRIGNKRIISSIPIPTEHRI